MHAAAQLPMPGYEEQTDQWQELEVPLPAYPRPENLLAIPIGGGSPHQFFVDSKSVVVGKDGVTRYTVVMKTSGGATNVSYEGIRCQTRERKIYAIGRSDGTWTQTRSAPWKRVLLQDRLPYSYTLFNQFFCNERTQPTSARRALDALKLGRGLAPGSAVDD